METRTLTSTTALNEHLGWPGVAQVCRIERQRRIRGQTQTDVAYFITSTGRERADAGRLLRFSRDHWGAIENGLHYVRDEAFGEDRCPIFRGHAPQNLAVVRNAALNWLRRLKTDNITATLRRFTRNSPRLFTLFGYVK